MQRILILLLLILVLCACLSACGQKGDLFLEDAGQQSSQPEKTAETVSSEDNDKPETGAQ
ncbi:MAG: hypothetical protein IMF09_01840 [Proteobacteria bacterium]|nr:hypothetical protein [Pseudomonadota bacterium]